ncbi:MAG: hypothetical protein ACXWH1_13760, partial [Thermoanaerobaculia bacterium]
MNRTIDGLRFRSEKGEDIHARSDFVRTGTFCWVELATTDPKKAKSFYASLFAWEVQDIPMGDQGTYHIFQKKGKDVGAMYPQPAEEKGVPPHWNNYVSV